jgi:TolA-binding protein
MKTIIISLALAFLCGACAQSPKIDSALLKKQIQRLEKKLKKSEHELASLNERYLVLESALEQKPGVDIPITEATQEIVTETAPEEKESPVAPMQNEHYMYAKVIESYRKLDSDTLKRVVHLFLKSFPQSVHADNALVLLGYHYLRLRQLNKAIEVYRSVEQNYPLANKIPAARLGLAFAYKAQQKLELAQKNLLDLQQNYPGSREALMAKTELQLLKAGG